jgi:hypothetical protein
MLTEKLHITCRNLGGFFQDTPSDGRSTGLSSGACCLCIGDSIPMCVGCAVCHQLTLPGLTHSSLASAYACILECNHGDDLLTSIAGKDPADILISATTPECDGQ